MKIYVNPRRMKQVQLGAMAKRKNVADCENEENRNCNTNVNRLIWRRWIVDVHEIKQNFVIEANDGK